MKNWNKSILMLTAALVAAPVFAEDAKTEAKPEAKTAKAPKAAKAAKAPKAKAGETKVEFKPEASVVAWEGKKVTGKHNGKIQLKKGELVMKGADLVGGSFEIDMASIVNEDLKDATYNKKLMDHLKSDDFFSVEKFKTATLTIKSAKSVPGFTGPTYEITADLTIKGKTNPITFPATVETKEGKTTAKANIAIDRTAYDIKYGSGKFFQNLGDKMIDDKFTLDVALATK